MYWSFYVRISIRFKSCTLTRERNRCNWRRLEITFFNIQVALILFLPLDVFILILRELRVITVLLMSIWTPIIKTIICLSIPAPSINSFLFLHSFKVSKILSSLFVFIFIKFLLSIWINNHDSLFISIILIAIIILLVPLVMFLILMLLHFRLMILTLNLFLIETICCVIGSHWI